MEVGKYVWFTLPKEQQGNGRDYMIAGKIDALKGKVVDVVCMEDGSLFSVPATNIKLMGHNSTLGVDDMIQLQDLHEGSLLFNLQIRYADAKIYTYTGSILVAVNPYQHLGIYGLEVVRKYEGQLIGTLPPHIFAIGAGCYGSMRKNAVNQCVVISGESGAGKTESTKLIMQYLAAVNSEKSIISEQILEANPLLESFGNAKTIRNHNSSRFGKYTELHYNVLGNISGSSIKQYLLEKSRLVNQQENERNYHIFYEMLVGLPDAMKKKLALTTADQYLYLNQGRVIKIDVKDDVEDFNKCTRAMEVLGFKPVEQESIYRVIASVIHLGNVSFQPEVRDNVEVAAVQAKTQLSIVAGLLGVNAVDLAEQLVTKSQITRGERIISPLSVTQALDTRDALSKALYSSMFSWLVDRVNSIVDKKIKSHSIGILDIFGFEDFKANSFEQLCINYANENLQFYFNQHIFKLEQETYEKEGISWKKLEFNDNQPTLDLINKRPVGIFHLLDDESNFPKSSDDSFLQKTLSQHGKNANFEAPRTKAPRFAVKHYAGTVWYEVFGFLEKNRDTFRDELQNLLRASTAGFVGQLMDTLSPPITGNEKAQARKKPTVASVFSESLAQLIGTMSQCAPYFVRCIKPNEVKLPKQFNNKMVLDQLRYSGMLETIRIRRAGYPVRIDFASFIFRFRSLLGGQKSTGPARETSNLILSTLPPALSDSYQLGHSKVFLREATELQLEELRGAALHGIVVILQKNVRRWLAVRHFKAIRKCVILLQACARRQIAVRRYEKTLRAIVVIQAFFKMIKPRKRFIAVRDEARRLRALERENARAAGLRMVVDVSNLHIPDVMEDLLQDDHIPPYFAPNALQIVDSSWKPVEYAAPSVPRDAAGHDFSKFVSGFFQQGSSWGFQKSSLSQSMLKLKPDDEKEAILIFNSILRFMGDPYVNDERELVVGNYIVQQAIYNPELRDEIYCQLCNQTWLNPNEVNAERGWLLMTICLSCFPPSDRLYPYLLCYITAHGYEEFKAYCQRKLLRLFGRQARHNPPTMLEWNAARKTASMAIYIKMTDGESLMIPIESSTTAHEAGNLAAQARTGASCSGWTVSVSSTTGEQPPLP